MNHDEMAAVLRQQGWAVEPPNGPPPRPDWPEGKYVIKAQVVCIQEEARQTNWHVADCRGTPGGAAYVKHALETLETGAQSCVQEIESLAAYSRETADTLQAVSAEREMWEQKATKAEETAARRLAHIRQMEVSAGRMRKKYNARGKTIYALIEKRNGRDEPALLPVLGRLPPDTPGDAEAAGWKRTNLPGVLNPLNTSRWPEGIGMVQCEGVPGVVDGIYFNEPQNITSDTLHPIPALAQHIPARIGEIWLRPHVAVWEGFTPPKYKCTDGIWRRLSYEMQSKGRGTALLWRVWIGDGPRKVGKWDDITYTNEEEATIRRDYLGSCVGFVIGLTVANIGYYGEPVFLVQSGAPSCNGSNTSILPEPKCDATTPGDHNWT